MVAMTKSETEDRGETQNIEDMKIKVKSPSISKSRPEYRCVSCDQQFPSQLDLTEHEKIDHEKRASISA
jgi:hypothetical protein